MISNIAPRTAASQNKTQYNNYKLTEHINQDNNNWIIKLQTVYTCMYTKCKKIIATEICVLSDTYLKSQLLCAQFAYNIQWLPKL